MATKDDEILADYSDDEGDVDVGEKKTTAAGGGAAAAAAAAAPAKKKGYTGMDASSFRDFYLKPEILQAITRHGFEHPSEVQQECIPQAILGTDVLCQAQSGMGKTAVFVLSTLQQLDLSVEGAVQVIVIAHTRELAFQIKKEYDRFAANMEGVRAEVVYGGVPVVTNRNMLKSDPPQILVGTPGRLLDLAQSKALRMDKVKHFVLDECDEILAPKGGNDNLSMRRDVQTVFKLAPRDKQVMMFSATLTPEIRELCKKFMTKPIEITVDNESKLTLHGLQQHYVKLDEADKLKKLMDLLDYLDFNQVMVFVRTPQRAQVLAKTLRDANFPVDALYSGMRQEQRINKFKEFKDNKFRILVSTNLTGRGIDVSKVNVVFNYDMPRTSDSYLHRVGRAGRFGTKGLALTFVSTEEDAKVLESVQARFEVNITPMPETIDRTTYMNA